MLLEVQWLDRAFYPLPAVVALVQVVGETLLLVWGLVVLEEGGELFVGEVRVGFREEEPEGLVV